MRGSPPPARLPRLAGPPKGERSRSRAIRTRHGGLCDECGRDRHAPANHQRDSTRARGGRPTETDRVRVMNADDSCTTEEAAPVKQSCPHHPYGDQGRIAGRSLQRVTELGLAYLVDAYGSHKVATKYT